MTDAALHDPGGKVRIVLPDGVIGSAEFHGPNDCYRTTLRRDWAGDDLGAGFLLFIGMNPSTADANVDDSTIKRETFFAKREGFRRFTKCNVMDYRATYPKDLRAPGVIPCSDRNLPEIRDRARYASMIVCCWGFVHPSFQKHADDVERSLRSDGHRLLCFGLTLSGNPKHPLYLRGDTPLIPFEENRS